MGDALKWLSISIHSNHHHQHTVEALLATMKNWKIAMRMNEDEEELVIWKKISYMDFNL